MPERNWEYEASILWPLLTSAATEKKKLIYEDLAAIINTNPLSMRYALDPIYKYCERIGIAPLTSIVVSKNNGKPGPGFTKLWGDNYQDAFEEAYSYDWSKELNPFENYTADDTSDSFAETLLNDPNDSETIYQKVKARGQAQYVFRTALLKSYQNSCSMCSCTLPPLLEAAHIMPWAKSSNKQKIDPRNGLLLCANHHKLFDSGILTISLEYEVICLDPDIAEKKFSNSDINLTSRIHGQKINLPKIRALWPLPEYIKDHHLTHDL